MCLLRSCDKNVAQKMHVSRVHEDKSIQLPKITAVLASANHLAIIVAMYDLPMVREVIMAIVNGNIVVKQVTSPAVNNPREIYVASLVPADGL